MNHQSIKSNSMINSYLFPNKYKKWGWFIFIPTCILGFFTVATDYAPEFLNTKVFAIYVDQIMGETKAFSVISNNILNEILGILIIISGILVGFSREQNEDELIAKIRLDSLVWATYLNYAILLLAFVFLYDITFLWVMILNMFTLLLFFIIRFNWQVNKLSKSLAND